MMLHLLSALNGSTLLRLRSSHVLEFLNVLSGLELVVPWLTKRTSTTKWVCSKMLFLLCLFSLKRKIEDAVLRAEMFASTALEMEEATWIKQEEMVRDFDMWDDPAKSNDILVKLANSAKVVDSLKDLKYKVEEAKLINQLAEINAIDYGLYKQAYETSLDVSEIVDQYEISKLLKGPFDMAGACLVIKAGPKGMYPKLWAEQILSMYLRWAKRQGYEGRIVDKCLYKNGGINSAIIEFEFECAYGYLSGEKGVHYLIRGSPNESSQLEASSATVDVIPMFLESACDLEIDSEDLIISSPLIHGKNKRQTDHTVCIQHIPTGISVQSYGERSHFANKMKALNRLKAKLLVTTKEQGVASIKSIQKENIVNLWQEEIRRYVSHPHKLVHDVKTGVEVPDLNYVLEGNIGPLIAAHINSRVMS
ncbi:peptide chain release factor PrfB3, chloroplastic-like isoform X2 [Glycine soja]|uniref:Peptide chain release factor PrfB3, chloroplastic n=1 Tax=Glycine soja TaxID=3848 RepID=A0A445IKS0_GLYSO|nr:peptide chain release factor PrfB3, chloroplastic-like isoform X2 [Glycine soja]RZB86639.1 Peptide chain release factor PrfB3, chloroplastic [Glycine soja]